MDRLPVELLSHIAASLEDLDEEGRIKTSHDLAILSRVNKTFNEIVCPILYLEPRLSDAKSAELWAKTYRSKVNPWTTMDCRAVLKDVIVPRKITLAPVYRDTEDRRFNRPDQNTPAVSLFRYNTLLTPFFFRNLTSFRACEPLVDNSFVSALFGPEGSNRNTIVELSIDISRRSQNLVLFLLQAFPYFYRERDDATGLIKVIDDRKHAEDAWERFVVGGLPNEKMERIRDQVDEIAIVKFSVFNRHHLGKPDSFDFLPDVLNMGQQISTSPFSNLRSLSLAVFTNAEIALIFLTPLFPQLRTLDLNGFFYTTPHFEDDVKMLRYSITRRRGTIEAPFPSEHQSDAFATLVESRSWDPLSKKESEDYPWKPHRGPDLDRLDLSLCEVCRGDLG